MPMLQVSVNCAPSTQLGCATTLSTRRAMASALPASAGRSSTRKLVAAHARQHIAGLQAALDALHHVQQHLVAHLMAQAVVDVTEAVQVHHQQRKGRRPASAGGQRRRTGGGPCSGGWAGR
jgi:hypothetical protein